MWVLDQLVTNPQHQSLLEALDFYIVPVVNPDGYEYAQTDVSSLTVPLNVKHLSEERCLFIYLLRTIFLRSRYATWKY